MPLREGTMVVSAWLSYMIPPSFRGDQARVPVEQFIWSPWVKSLMGDSGGWRVGRHLARTVNEETED